MQKGQVTKERKECTGIWLSAIYRTFEYTMEIASTLNLRWRVDMSDHITLLETMKKQMKQEANKVKDSLKHADQYHYPLYKPLAEAEKLLRAQCRQIDRYLDNHKNSDA